MISFKDAQNIILRQKQLSKTVLPIDQCAGYVAGENIRSEVFVPSFINSAVDGFAVRSSDLLEARVNNKVELKVVGRTMAGDACEKDERIPNGSNGIGAWEIMTGACVPKGYDAVIPVEKVETLSLNDEQYPSIVSFQNPVNGQANIRMPGEDYKPENLIVEMGQKITSASIMALSAVGQNTISVVSKPRITLYSSGNEVISNGSLTLQSGQIRDANGPYLKSALTESGMAKTKFAGILSDDVEQFKTTILNEFDETDIFISTGGVSAGRHDFIPDALRGMGAEIQFHKVVIRPGKPILYANFSNGKHYFGLPGNPISAAVGLRFFVLPLLRHLQSMPIEVPLKARLKSRVTKNHDFLFFAKSKVSVTAEAELIVDVLDGQESFKTHPLLEANCWAVFKEGDYALDKGELVDVYPLTPGCVDLSKEFR
ncbi:MAG: molybdopterin molybdotransferase MoeA [Rhodomicrobiaceae bacterium]